MEFKPRCERLHDATRIKTHTATLFAFLCLLADEISPVQDVAIIYFNAEFYLLSTLPRI